MPPSSYRLSDFDFALPAELIAQHPAPERSASRLLHVDGDRRADLGFSALPELLAPGDVLVFNNTRVVKSRLFGRKPTGGQVEIMLERIESHSRAWVQLRSSNAPRAGGTIELTSGAVATVIEREGRFFLLDLDANVSFSDYLDRHGEVPLPPYIARPADGADSERYQTVYAREAGAVAAPTAGLHFDHAMLARIATLGVASAFITLHVGAGTFLPVETDDLTQHSMHSERFTITPEAVATIARARSAAHRVVAVGTTSLRALESVAGPAGELVAGDGETALFITPGYRFRVVDRLLTNFHLPRSTLLMLVSAFAGYDAIRAAYAHAIRERYRFFSYGDAMLLERAAPL